RVDHEEDGIGLFDGRFGLSTHTTGQTFRSGLLQSGGIDHGEGDVAKSAFPLAPVAGNAGLVVNKCKPAADQPVEEGRLADIGAADNGDCEWHEWLSGRARRPGFLACYACQREKVPGCGDDGQGAVVDCPCVGQGDWACCGAGCGFCWGHGAICCCGWLAACAGCCDALRGFAARFGFGFGSSSDAAAFFSGSASSAALFCSAAGACKACAVSGGGGLPFTYSGGIPCVTPGTPPGNSSLRSPENFFFSLRTNTASLSGSKSAQPASAGMASASVTSNTIRELARMLSALSVRRDQRRQDIRTRADADRALGIACNHVDIFAGSGDVMAFPSRQGEQLTRRVSKTPRRLGNRVEPTPHVSQWRRVNKQQSRAHRGQILPDDSERSVSRNFVIGFHGVHRFGLRKRACGAHAREHAIAGRRL